MRGGGGPGRPGSRNDIVTTTNPVWFSKIFFLLKAYENCHHFLFYRKLPNINRLSSTRLQSDEGQQHHLHRAKFNNFQFLSYRNVIYLKRKLRTCRIQNQAEKVWFDWKKNWSKSKFLIFDSKLKAIRCLWGPRFFLARTWIRLKGTKSRNFSHFEHTYKEPEGFSCDPGLPGPPPRPR